MLYEVVMFLGTYRFILSFFLFKMRAAGLFLPMTLLFVRLMHNTYLFGSCSLVILGNITEFERGILWLSENLTLDVDARINLFEVILFDYCHC